MIDRMRSKVVGRQTAHALAIAILSSFVFITAVPAQTSGPLTIIGYSDAESLIFMDALAFGLSQPGPTQTTQVPINGLRAHDWYTATISSQPPRLCLPAGINFDGAHLWQIANDILSGPNAPDVVAQAVSAEVQTRYACSSQANVRQIYDGAIR